VRARSTRRAIAAIGMAGILIAAAGCGSDDNDSSTSASAGTTSTAAAPAAKSIKVGLVTDIGGLNDRSFNALANQGLETAKSSLGVQGRVLTSKSNADYVPNLSTLAQQKYDLVIGVGFLMADAVDTVAKKFPDTKFAIIDDSSLTDKNVTSLVFSEEQGSYLVGVIAAQATRSSSPATWRATSPACTPRTTTSRRSRPSAVRRSRRSTTTSRATRPAPRRPTRASRRSTPTPRTSSTRRSARRSR